MREKELDIVAEYRNELIVIEVKTRKNTRFGNPEDAVTDKKIRRIIASTDAYLRKFSVDLPVRFDIITLVGEKAPFTIEHIEEAFILRFGRNIYIIYGHRNNTRHCIRKKGTTEEFPFDNVTLVFKVMGKCMPASDWTTRNGYL